MNQVIRELQLQIIKEIQLQMIYEELVKTSNEYKETKKETNTNESEEIGGNKVNKKIDRFEMLVKVVRDLLDEDYYEMEDEVYIGILKTLYDSLPSVYMERIW